MDKKMVSLAFVSTLLLLATFGARIIVPVNATEHHVYPGESIQAKIDLAEPIDTIFVHAGTYYEHLVVNKTVSLIGENPVTTIIDGSGTGRVVSVKAPDVEIRGFTIQNGGNAMVDCGIFLGNRTEKISNNILRRNCHGLFLLQCNRSNIFGNTLMNNFFAGIYISDSSNNTIYGNSIANNFYGAYIASSAIPNIFYCNNFVNNTNQSFPGPGTKYDNDTEGNYWDDYIGVDEDGDGIGDTETPHLGLDWYPLIIPTSPFPVVYDDVIYPVALLSNSTISRFYFSQPLKEIGFYINGPLNSTGFCNITIPRQLLRNNPWKILLDNESLSFIPSANETHTFLYFTYNHSLQKVRIIGTEVIPEFPVTTVLPLSFIVTLIAIVLRKSKKEMPE